MKESLRNRKCSCRLLVLFLLFGLSFSACRKTDSPTSLVAEVLEINDFGGALLKLSPEEMATAQFELGDVLQVAFNDTLLNIPYFDGFYCRVGDMQLTAYRNTPNIEFTAPFCGLSDELGVNVGTKLTVKMFEKGSALDVQRAMAMEFSNDIADYHNDTVKFANARMVKKGRIAENRLYRSSSPFDDTYCRAFCASSFLKNKGIQPPAL